MVEKKDFGDEGSVIDYRSYWSQVLMLLLVVMGGGRAGVGFSAEGGASRRSCN